MSLKKRFDRDQSYRFSPYNGFTKLLHLAYLHVLRDVNNVISFHHRMHVGRNRAERCGLQLHQTATANQHIRCPLEMPAHGLRVLEVPGHRPTVTNLGRKDTGKLGVSSKEHIAILSRGPIHNRAPHRGDR